MKGKRKSESINHGHLPPAVAVLQTLFAQLWRLDLLQRLICLVCFVLVLFYAGISGRSALWFQYLQCGRDNYFLLNPCGLRRADYYPGCGFSAMDLTAICGGVGLIVVYTGDSCSVFLCPLWKTICKQKTRISAGDFSLQ
jgi:hypothetical protein